MQSNPPAGGYLLLYRHVKSNGYFFTADEGFIRLNATRNYSVWIHNVLTCSRYNRTTAGVVLLDGFYVMHSYTPLFTFLRRLTLKRCHWHFNMGVDMLHGFWIVRLLLISPQRACMSCFGPIEHWLLQGVTFIGTEMPH